LETEQGREAKDQGQEEVEAVEVWAEVAVKAEAWVEVEWAAIVQVQAQAEIAFAPVVERKSSIRQECLVIH